MRTSGPPFSAYYFLGLFGVVVFGGGYYGRGVIRGSEVGDGLFLQVEACGPRGFDGGWHVGWNGGVDCSHGCGLSNYTLTRVPVPTKYVHKTR